MYKYVHQIYTLVLYSWSIRANDNTQHFLGVNSELRHQQSEPSSLEVFVKVNIPAPFPFPLYSFHTCLARRRRGSSCAAWGRLVLRSPNPLLSLLMIAAAAPRQLTPIPTPTHVDRHLSGSAALLRLSRCLIAVPSPPPLSRRCR